jgi:PH and SEC7 domain-containing protein
VSQDSTRLTSQSTPIISGGEDLDMEARGKELAARCWDENEEFLAKEKIAEWLGGQYVFFLLLKCFFCLGG